MEIDLLAEFMLRGHCGPWHPVMKWSSIVANGTITVCYLWIPVILLQELALIVPGSSIPSRSQRTLLLSIAAFVGFCGVGHLESVMSFFDSRYHLWVVWDVLTAVVSAWAAVEVTLHRGIISENLTRAWNE